MNTWRTAFNEFWNTNIFKPLGKDDFETFIETEIITKILDDIPDNMPGCGCDEGTVIKQSLKNKWLK